MPRAANQSGRWTRLARVAVTLVFLLPAANVLGGDEAAEKAAELKDLRTRIDALKHELQSSRKKKSRAEQQLESIERDIQSTSRDLRRIENRLAESQAQLGTLEGERDRTVALLGRQANRLAGEARAAYAMGRQQQVKLLLNQEQPSAMGRMLTYFKYLSGARTEQIAAMRASLANLQTLESEIALEIQAARDLRDDRKQQQAALEERKEQRQALLAALSEKLVAQGEELATLKSNEKQLQALLASLQELLSDIPPDASHHRPFRTLKGKLSWPANGQLTHRFGTRRGSSGLTWQGVLISAPSGGVVRAVSQGRVAFADWMRGFGLLLIIDHGDGYMSLYGQNQALYKEVGEWVDTGEVVATLGASGGQTDTGLYFELRHKGRPINPVSWCSGKPGLVHG